VSLRSGRYNVEVHVRNPHLYAALRSFCLAGFAVLAAEAGKSGEIPFVVEEHAGLYEYRPLLRDLVEASAPLLAELEDAEIALEELRREPAAAIFAPGPASGGLFRAILLPLLDATAEACGGFDWEDGAFNRVYGELEHSLFGTSRRYAAAAPLIGVSIGAPIELARGVRVAAASPSEPERGCVLAFERDLPAGETSVPDAPAELADAVTALRLATGAPVAVGPFVHEQLDGHPLEPRPALEIASSEPPGESTRLDPWRGRLAAELLARLGASEEDAELAEALERWELALFEAEPLRSERLREALAALLGGADGLWAATMRAALLLGESVPDRARLVEGLRMLARGEQADAETAEAVRRATVEVVLHDDRSRLARTLDDALLGLRPRPAGYFSARASAA
jgi:hypothetical protein